MNSNAWKRVREQNKITLYADNKPYQVIDLKDIDDMSEEEYNDKLKDAWFKKTHYETVEELTMAKYYNYEVEEEKKPEETVEELTMAKYYNYEVEEEKKPEETENNKPLGFTAEIFSVVFSLLFIGGIIGTLFWILGSLISGG